MHHALTATRHRTRQLLAHPRLRLFHRESVSSLRPLLGSSLEVGSRLHPKSPTNVHLSKWPRAYSLVRSREGQSRDPSSLLLLLLPNPLHLFVNNPARTKESGAPLCEGRKLIGPLWSYAPFSLSSLPCVMTLFFFYVYDCYGFYEYFITALSRRIFHFTPGFAIFSRYV